VNAIDWTAFDWQSFATLATGGAAVLGASIVGFRQVGITEKQASIAEAQNAILARQTEIEAQKLKAELFERRLATFDATADFIINVREYRLDQQAEGRIAFLAKMRESQFLFSPSVYRDLNEIFRHGQALWMAIAMMRSDEDHDVPRDPAHSRQAFNEGNWLLQRLETLAEVFRADLRLDDLGSGAGGWPMPPN
jgi:hypothetical protein